VEGRLLHYPLPKEEGKKNWGNPDEIKQMQSSLAQTEPGGELKREVGGKRKRGKGKIEKGVAGEREKRFPYLVPMARPGQ